MTLNDFWTSEGVSFYWQNLENSAVTSEPQKWRSDDVDCGSIDLFSHWFWDFEILLIGCKKKDIWVSSW